MRVAGRGGARDAGDDLVVQDQAELVGRTEGGDRGGVCVLRVLAGELRAGVVVAVVAAAAGATAKHRVLALGGRGGDLRGRQCPARACADREGRPAHEVGGAVGNADPLVHAGPARPL